MLFLVYLIETEGSLKPVASGGWGGILIQILHVNERKEKVRNEQEKKNTKRELYDRSPPS